MANDLDRFWLEETLAPLRRSDSSGLGSGLSRAIAAHLGIDVVIVRVAFVALTFCAGLGPALYGWGTLLTVGPHGTRPIDSTIAGFRSWSKTAQLALVVGSSLAFVIIVGASTSLPWGLALLAMVGIWWLLRRGRGHIRNAEALFPAQPMDENELVEQWRRQTSAAAGRQVVPPTPLTLLPEPEPHRPPQPAAGRAWLMGLLLIAAAVAAGALCLGVLGMSVAASIAVSTIMLGVSLAVFAAVSRTRRLPRSLLALLILPLVACGWLSTGGILGAAPEDGTHTVRVVATSSTVDLTELTDTDTVEIIAVASDVKVIVPGIPEDGIMATKRFSTVDVPPGGGTPAWSVRLVIDATASSVTVVEEKR